MEAAQRLSQDFFKYEPDAKQLAAEYHLTGIHPAYVTAHRQQLPAVDELRRRTGQTVSRHSRTRRTRAPGAPTAAPVTVEQPGPLPSFLDPSTDYGDVSGTPNR